MNRYLSALATVAVILGGTGASVSSVAAQTAPVARHPFMRPAQGAMHDMMLNGQAKALGITVDDLKARLASGKTFQQIVQDLGITPDQMKAKLEAQHQARVDAMKAKIQAEVTSGKLTQAQADKMLARLNGPPQAMPHGKMGSMMAHHGFGKKVPAQK